MSIFMLSDHGEMFFYSNNVPSAHDLTRPTGQAEIMMVQPMETEDFVTLPPVCSNTIIYDSLRPTLVMKLCDHFNCCLFSYVTAGTEDLRLIRGSGANSGVAGSPENPRPPH